MKDLVFLGGGRNLLDTLDVVDAINRIEQTWRVRGILDDHRKCGDSYCGYPVLGGLQKAQEMTDCKFVSTIWNEQVSSQLHDVLARTGLEESAYATLVHPGAAVSDRAQLGTGVLVNFGASIAGEVKISNIVSIGPGCIVGHDSIVESYTVAAAGAVISGNVHVKQNCYIGSGSVIRQDLEIGSGALIGLGAVVTKDVPAMVTVVGNPARPYENRKT